MKRNILYLTLILLVVVAGIRSQPMGLAAGGRNTGPVVDSAPPSHVLNGHRCITVFLTDDELYYHCDSDGFHLMERGATFGKDLGTDSPIWKQLTSGRDSSTVVKGLLDIIEVLDKELDEKMNPGRTPFTPWAPSSHADTSAKKGKLIWY